MVTIIYLILAIYAVKMTIRYFDNTFNQDYD